MPDRKYEIQPMLNTLLLVMVILFGGAAVSCAPVALEAGSHESVALEVRGKTAKDISVWLDTFAGNFLDTEPVAGMTILVGKGDDVVVAKSYGYADLENQLASQVETVYQIGSLTKQFTAVAILQLEQQGKLKLSDDITEYLPGYPTHGNTITIADILYHTSGIKNYIAVGYTDSRIAPGRPVNQAEYRLELRPEEMMGFFSNEALEFEPGSGWNYTNSGYYLAGLIIEKVSGLSYADYIETNLFAPALMTASSYTNFEKIVNHRARGYKVKDGQLLNADPLSMTVPFSAGALSSTVTDLFRWNRVLHESNRLIGKPAYKKLTTPGSLNNGQPLPLDYALGLAATRRDGNLALLHPGGINGFSSMFSYFPEHELSIVVLTNTYNRKSRSAADKVELHLAAYLLDTDIDKVDFR